MDGMNTTRGVPFDPSRASRRRLLERQLRQLRNDQHATNDWDRKVDLMYRIDKTRKMLDQS